MLFRRKKKKRDKAGLSTNRRKHYRRSPGKKHSLGVVMEMPGNKSMSGEIVDLSAGGAAISFVAIRDPKLVKEQIVTLKFSSLSHGGEIVVQARVVMVRGDDGEDRRYSFEFTDVQSLFEQLDTYYSSFFNRREFMRIRPALDSKLPLTIFGGKEVIEVRVNDLSLMGVGFVLNLEQAALLEGVKSVEVRFRVPKTKTEICTRADIQHVTERGEALVFGLEFKPDDPDQLLKNPDFVGYVNRRSEEMARWENAG